MLDVLVQPLIETAIDQVAAAGVDALGGATEHGVERREAAGGSSLVRSIVEGALASRPRAELEAEAVGVGTAPVAARQLVDRLLVRCHEQIEMRMFRWATATAAAAWIAPASAGLLYACSTIAWGPESAAATLEHPLATIGAAIATLAVFVGVLGAKTLFPRWYAIHEALAVNGASQSIRIATVRLATWLGPVGGHYWYLGHRGYSRRSGPGRIVGALLLMGTGIPALVAWFTAWQLAGASDEQFERWALGLPLRGSPAAWPWLAALHRRSSRLSQATLVFLGLVAVGLVLAGALFVPVGVLVIVGEGSRMLGRAAICLASGGGAIVAGVWLGRRCLGQAAALRGTRR